MEPIERMQVKLHFVKEIKNQYISLLCINIFIQNFFIFNMKSYF